MTRLLPSLLLAGCGWLAPELPELVRDPQLVPVGDAREVPVDLVLPTTVVAAPTGVLVLDGERAVRVDGDGVRADAGPWQGALRATTTDDAWWVARPEGVLARVGFPQPARAGAVETLVTTTLPLRTADVPLAVVETSAGLVVGTRDGAILHLAADGTELARHTLDVDGQRLGTIADLEVLPYGGIAAVDALGPKVHLLAADGTPVSWIGESGPWIGYLLKPKAVLGGPDGTLLVADSRQGAVQVFDADGTALGALALDGAPLALVHPVDLARDGDRIVVLDQAAGHLLSFTLTDAAVAAARDAARVRHLRTELVEARAEDAEGDRRLCFQCHDGFVNDDRAVWDPRLDHHPIGVVADLVDIPDGFPLDAAGKLRCATCHSPHGVSTLDQVDAASHGGALARAASGDHDLFLRARRSDSTLCRACHGDAVHEADALGLAAAGAHPSGQALADALAARGTPVDALGLPEGGDGCLGCHAVHAAADGVLRPDLAGGGACLACHADKDDHHPLPAADADGRGACLACHDPGSGHGGALLVHTGAAACTTCHDDVHLRHGRQKGAHGVPCLTCHAPHDGGRALLTTLVDASGPDADGCLSCHAAADAGHPVGEEPTCRSCHTDPHAPADTAACGTCHDDQHAAAARGGHGGVACAGCHPPHDAVRRSGPPDVDAGSRRCLGCHDAGTPGRGTKLVAYGHPAPVFADDGPRWGALDGLPLFDADGTAVPPDTNGVLACGSCHVTHGPDPDKPGDHLRRPGWQAACSACHGEDALPYYRYFHDPRRRASVTGAR